MWTELLAYLRGRAFRRDLGWAGVGVLVVLGLLLGYAWMHPGPPPGVR